MPALLATTAAADPHPAFILPFVALLLCIAILPIQCLHFWERHYRSIVFGLSLITVDYYLFILHAGPHLVAIGWEYVCFMVLIGALYVVAGGLHINLRGEARPWHNLVFLLGGAVLANFIGTTGASMVLIRPWIRLNRYRYSDFHTAFFIFIVSNVGGCLTPIGDPPLFLGYLQGVPFWWIATRSLGAWALAIGLLAGLFYVRDRLSFLEARRGRGKPGGGIGSPRVEGWSNLGWLAVILCAVFLKSPRGLREGLTVLAAIGSLCTTHRSIHEANRFSFGPIKEVAWLFAGLFATMVPALDFLEGHAASLGLSSPLHYYWACGLLSGVLDNAPTYLAFLTSALGLQHFRLGDAAQVAQFLQSNPGHVLAVSLSSVFFGGLTYMGNGPNLMVKAITEQQGVHAPHFFRYVYAFGLPVLLPILALVGWLFFAK